MGQILSCGGYSGGPAHGGRTIKVFSSPDTIGEAVFITCFSLGLNIEVEDVDGHSTQYKAINPTSTVPALLLENGLLVTELSLVFTTLCDQAVREETAPAGFVLTHPHGTPERLRLQDLLHWICNEMHTNLSSLMQPEVSSNQTLKDYFLSKAAMNVQYVETQVLRKNKPFLLSDQLLVCDIVMHTLLKWCYKLNVNIDFPLTRLYLKRLGLIPKLIAANALLKSVSPPPSPRGSPEKDFGATPRRRRTSMTQPAELTF